MAVVTRRWSVAVADADGLLLWLCGRRLPLLVADLPLVLVIILAVPDMLLILHAFPCDRRILSRFGNFKREIASCKALKQLTVKFP